MAGEFINQVLFLYNDVGYNKDRLYFIEFLRKNKFLFNGMSLKENRLSV